MLKIKLRIDGEEKTFTEAYPTLKHMKLAASFLNKVEEDLLTSDEQFEEAIALICNIFKDDAVNYDSVTDGLSPDDWNTTVMDIIYKIVDGETKKVGKSTRLQLVEKATKEAMTKLKEVN